MSFNRGNSLLKVKVGLWYGSTFIWVAEPVAAVACHILKGSVGFVYSVDKLCLHGDHTCNC